MRISCFTDPDELDYDMYNDKYGILLKGKCKKCFGEVARLIEID